MLKKIPKNRIVMESNAPNCWIKRNHYGWKFVESHFHQLPASKYREDEMVEGRNEPARLIQLLEILSNVFGMEDKELAETLWDNS